MVQTRTQKALKRGRNLEDQDTPTLKQKRQKTDPKPLQQPQILSLSDVDPNNPIDVWRKKGRWPPDMERLLSRKRSLSALSKRKRSDSSVTPSDQRPREEKSAPYRDPRYEAILQTKGAWMTTSELGVTDHSKQVCRDLLGGIQPTPTGSIFDDPVFEKACYNLRNRNEARVIQDLSRLIVPSVETLGLHDENKHLAILTESVNEGWTNAIPLTGSRPQPDYSIGFRRNAFTDEQLTKLSPFIGRFLGGDVSYFMATYYLYFPLFACEVMCGAAALNVADRQNAHSMTLAVRGIVELFRLIGRENELHREILAFSISHDHCSVRIYGYYPVIDGRSINYYRHPIYNFDFTTLEGKERWTAYRFVKNMYDNWVPTHFRRICSAIDQLPSVDFNVPALSESMGLSEDSENAARSEALASSLVDEDDDSGQMATPTASLPKPAKRRRKSPVKRP